MSEHDCRAALVRLAADTHSPLETLEGLVERHRQIVSKLRADGYLSKSGPPNGYGEKERGYLEELLSPPC